MTNNVTPYIPTNHKLLEVLDHNHGEGVILFLTQFRCCTGKNMVCGYMDIQKSYFFPHISRLLQNTSDDWEVTQELQSKIQITYTSIVDGTAGKYIRIGIDNSGFTQSSMEKFRSQLVELSLSVVAYARKQELLEMLGIVENGFDAMNVSQLKKLVSMAPGLIERAFLKSEVVKSDIV